MSLWKCEEPGCRSKSFGVGEAIGLRAIGWHVGGKIKCPKHRPDPLPSCLTNVNYGPCSICKAVTEAKEIQHVILNLLEPVSVSHE